MSPLVSFQCHIHGSELTWLSFFDSASYRKANFFFFLICNSCSVNPEQYYIGEEKFNSQYEVILLKLDFLHGGNQEFSVLYIFIHHVSLSEKASIICLLKLLQRVVPIVDDTLARVFMRNTQPFGLLIINVIQRTRFIKRSKHNGQGCFFFHSEEADCLVIYLCSVWAAVFRY